MKTKPAKNKTSDYCACGWCGKPIKGKEESTPGGSMHPRCAKAYERKKPEDW